MNKGRLIFTILESLKRKKVLSLFHCSQGEQRALFARKGLWLKGEVGRKHRWHLNESNLRLQVCVSLLLKLVYSDFFLFLPISSSFKQPQNVL